ncbi:hypothetical protein SO802_027086 [Lithocarpus litseifolius]|uniref:Uncharacterized protein n=1 Tax=Lithocarpus litseifolius TaxID=425828 RepID=A0AAW2C1K6_9ROSI
MVLSSGFLPVTVKYRCFMVSRYFDEICCRRLLKFSIESFSFFLSLFTTKVLVQSEDKLGPHRLELDFDQLVFLRARDTDISISQSRDSTSGIPQYIVQIVNTCVSGCAPSDIHLHCGWFASARIINPRTFKRLSYDDCLVNGGKPLKTSQVIRFTYSNSFMYPLAFKSAKFC